MSNDPSDRKLVEQYIYLLRNHTLGSESINIHLKSQKHIWRPPTDVYETNDFYLVKVEIAGMKRDQFEITMEDNALIIHGSRKGTTEKNAVNQMEINFGEFVTGVEFLNSIVSEGIEAEYSNGFLSISLPKAKPREIFIKKV